MSYYSSSQVIKRRVWFSDSVTGTPTAQVYIDNTATGSPISGTGSGSEWAFEVTLPSGLTVGSSVQVVASATVGSWTERTEVIEGSIVSLLTSSSLGLTEAQESKLNSIYTATRSAIVTVTGVVTQGGVINVIKGEDYYADDDRGVTWTGESADIWPDLTDATLVFSLIGQDDKTLTPVVSTPTGTQVLTMNIPASFTSDLPEGKFSYRLKATLSSGRIMTLIESSFTTT